jgi:hypothetical protein
MSKKLLTAASFALGGAGVVLVGYLSANPLAFTHPVGDLPWQTATSPRAVAVETPVAMQSPSSELVFPKVTISPSPAKPAKARRRIAKLAPCSAWSEIGPTFISTEGTPAFRRVRHLCTDNPIW